MPTGENSSKRKMRWNSLINVGPLQSLCETSGNIRLWKGASWKIKSQQLCDQAFTLFGVKNLLIIPVLLCDQASTLLGFRILSILLVLPWCYLSDTGRVLNWLVYFWFRVPTRWTLCEKQILRRALCKTL